MEQTKVNAGIAEREYIAFISYRHKPYDMAVAKKTHALIEKYRVPKSLQKENGNKLGIAFRDQEELPVSVDLTADICKALDHSKYLVVICTPDTPESIWVEREITYFLQHHDRSHVLAVLASGNPETSFPYALTHLDDENKTIVEPLAANICADTEPESLKLLSKESIRLFAAILGCPYDALVQREQKRKQKRITAIALIAFAVLIGYVGILLRSNRRIEAKNQEILAQSQEIEARNQEIEARNREIETKNQEIEARNEEIETKNQELEEMNTSLNEQKRELQLVESSYLTASAEAALAEDNFIDAIRYSVDALPKADDDRPYYAPAEGALMNALGIFDNKTSKTALVSTDIELNAPAKLLKVTNDGKSIIAIDEYNTLYSWDTHTGVLNWKVSLNRIVSRSYSSSMKIAAALDDDARMIYILYSWEIIALKMDSGEIVWQTGNKNYYFRFSLDETKHSLICLKNADGSGFSGEQFDIVILDALSGAETQRCALEKTFSNGDPYRATDLEKENGNAVFSSTGQFFAGVIYDGSILESGEINYYIVDLAANEARVAYTEPYNGNNYLIILWMELQEKEDRQVLTVISQSSENSNGLTYKKIDLTAGELVSQIELTPEVGSIKYPRENRVLRLNKRELLVADSNLLYMINVSTGRVMVQEDMGSPILSLFSLESWIWGCIRADGTYTINFLNSRGSITSSSILGFSFNLGPISDAEPGNSGFMRPETTNGSLKTIWVGEYANDFGFIAVTDASNERIIKIEHLTLIGHSDIDTVLNTDDALLYTSNTAIDGLSVWINQDGLFVYSTLDYKSEGTTYFWYVYDPVADTLIGTYEYTREKYQIDSMWPLLSKHRLLLLSLYGDIVCYDFDTGETRELASKTSDYRNKADSVLITEENRVLTAYCDQENLLIWSDGELQQKVKLPKEMRWFVLDNNTFEFSRILEVGENGYVLLSNHAQDSKEVYIEQFVLYNTWDNSWTWVDDVSHGTYNRIFTLGTVKDWFVVYEQNLIANIYSISENHIIQTIETHVLSDSVADIRLIDEDRYLVILAKDGMLEIYDTENGACVYAGKLPHDYCKRIAIQIDHKNNRLYLIEQFSHTGLCFDLTTWSKLAEFSGVYGYDEKTNCLLISDQNNRLLMRRIPTTEELVQMGQSVLESQ